MTSSLLLVPTKYRIREITKATSRRLSTEYIISQMNCKRQVLWDLKSHYGLIGSEVLWTRWIMSRVLKGYQHPLRYKGKTVLRGAVCEQGKWTLVFLRGSEEEGSLVPHGSFREEQAL